MPSLSVEVDFELPKPDSHAAFHVDLVDVFDVKQRILGRFVKVATMAI